MFSCSIPYTLPFQAGMKPKTPSNMSTTSTTQNCMQSEITRYYKIMDQIDYAENILQFIVPPLEVKPTIQQLLDEALTCMCEETTVPAGARAGAGSKEADNDDDTLIQLQSGKACVNQPVVARKRPNQEMCLPDVLTFYKTHTDLPLFHLLGTLYFKQQVYSNDTTIHVTTILPYEMEKCFNCNYCY